MNHQMIEVLSLSASKTSVSRACVNTIADTLKDSHCIPSVTDIRELPPIWGNNVKVPNLPEEYNSLFERVNNSSGVVFCFPIYCYSASGATKTISEVLGGQGGALTNKPIAFLAASGTTRSHLALRDLMSSMAFEQSSFCFPRHISVQASDLDDEQKPKPETTQRIEKVIREFAQFCSAITQFNSEASS